MSTVLLVDDEVDAREAIARYLTRAGHVVHCAGNGREALTRLFEVSPDAVILDGRMPEMDGVGFLEVIRCYLRWQHLPVILLTAYPEAGYINRAMELGVRKTFLKAHCDTQDLLAEVEACRAPYGLAPDSTNHGTGHFPA